MHVYSLYNSSLYLLNQSKPVQQQQKSFEERQCDNALLNVSVL